jgi:hypothetical protein
VACALLDRIGKRLSFSASPAQAYPARRCSGRGLRSGAIYDALHLLAAEREAADIFLTFNVDDFRRLAEPTSPRVLAPPDPPRLPA